MSLYLQKRREQKLGIVTKTQLEAIVEAPKKKSTNPVPKLLEAAEKQFNAFIRKRDKDKGCICGCGKKVNQAGHCFPKTYSSVRFDEMNVHGINKDCNYFCKEAIDPKVIEGVKKRIGETEYKWLEKRSKGVKKWSREELLEITEEYKFKCKA